MAIKSHGKTQSIRYTAFYLDKNFYAFVHMKTWSVLGDLQLPNLLHNRKKQYSISHFPYLSSENFPLLLASRPLTDCLRALQFDSSQTLSF